MEAESEREVLCPGYRITNVGEVFSCEYNLTTTCGARVEILLEAWTEGRMVQSPKTWEHHQLNRIIGVHTALQTVQLWIISVNRDVAGEADANLLVKSVNIHISEANRWRAYRS